MIRRTSFQQNAITVFADLSQTINPKYLLVKNNLLLSITKSPTHQQANKKTSTKIGFSTYINCPERISIERIKDNKQIN